VISSGPYWLVSHPGYAGSLIYNLAVPLVWARGGPLSPCCHRCPDHRPHQVGRLYASGRAIRLPDLRSQRPAPVVPWCVVGQDQTLNAPICAFLTANVISMIGNHLTVLTVPRFVLETMSSATQTGLVGFFTMRNYERFIKRGNNCPHS